MATRLTLIAHAATAAARRSAFAADEPLEIAALHAVSGHESWNRARVLISPMIAAGQTAQRLGLSGAVDAGLADLDVGAWRGQAIADVAAAHPIDLGHWMTDAGFDGHGGESRDALRHRAGAFLRDCVAKGGHTLAITHAAVIRALIVETLDAPDASYWKLDIAPFTLTDLRHDGRRWALRQMGVQVSGAV